MDIRAWVTRVITDLHAFEYNHMADRVGDPDEVVANWVIRCLGNPACEGSGDVLQEIGRHRHEVNHE